MTIKMAVLMDPVAHLKPTKDTTLAMIQRAQELGWNCVCLTLNDLVCLEGRAFAHVYALQFNPKKPDALPVLSSLGECPLADFDIILMRKDPPFNLEYIYATYALELAEREGVLVANNPQSLRDANEKFFTLQFPQCCPPTLVSRNNRLLREFWEQHRQVIFKPLAGMGGSSVFYVDEGGQNLSVILELLTDKEQITIMAQRYIPEIHTTGDKRILVLHGEPVPFGLARIPAQGETRGNLAAGGHGQVVPITARDRWLCEQIAPTLKAKGLSFVGIDVIGDYLTEINVTSPTCVREIMHETQLDITGDYLQRLALSIQQ